MYETIRRLPFLHSLRHILPVADFQPTAMPNHADPNPSTVPPDPAGKPLWLLLVCTALIVAILIGADISVLLNLRESTLRSSEANLHNISLALAEQADRAVQGVDMVLDSMAQFVVAAGADDADAFEQKMAGEPVHHLLKDKLVGLPYINAVTMIKRDGNLINFSRYWPIPQVNVADRDYFKALRADPAMPRFVSIPVRNRGDSAWTVYLARRAPSHDRSFIGLLLGAIDLRYFEDFYRSLRPGADSAISLIREDGVMLVRYPPAGVTGKVFPFGGRRALEAGKNGVIRDISPVDGTIRIKAAAMLANFPIFVLVTQTETAALQGWYSVAWVMSLITAGCVLAILIAALAIARWWRQQQTLALACREHATADQARAAAEAGLLRERERAAEAASRAKSDFLAVMSHEIRTPMNAVLGLTSSLYDTPLTPAQQEVVKAIRDSGDSLLRILNDILDFSKLDAGRMTFETAPFSPATLTQNTVSVLGPRARAKGLEITAESDPDLPAALLGDAGRIRQVLLNLVSNAVKFTHAGRVTIRARCPDCAAGTAIVEWSVSDTGIGIPEEQIPSLFGEFVQADSSINRRFGGSGLGLAISKRLVEQMGGTISAESVVGAGTTFRVRLVLPLAEAPAATPQPVTVETAHALQMQLAALGRPLRLLLAEDNPTNQFVALQMLKGLPVQVDVVGDGLEAVHAASSFAYDVIFMDMRMPEMDGLAATRRIRQRGGVLAAVPIIALTANAFPEDVKACWEAGMNQFVTKPVSKDTMLAAILRALSPADQAPAFVPEAAAAETPGCDRAALHGLAVDIGEDGVAEMLEVFAQETRARLQRMAAPDIPPATLMREAHTLKGAAGTVCASLLCGRAAALEERLRSGRLAAPGDIAGLHTAFDAFIEVIETSDIMPPVMV
jgi:hypothetical protein